MTPQEAGKCLSRIDEKMNYLRKQANEYRSKLRIAQEANDLEARLPLIVLGDRIDQEIDGANALTYRVFKRYYDKIDKLEKRKVITNTKIADLSELISKADRDVVGDLELEVRHVDNELGKLHSDFQNFPFLYSDFPNPPEEDDYKF